VSIFFRATPPLRMASIQVHNVALQQNPDRYTADFNFHIRFDALEDIPDDLNWKLVYVGSGESDKHDQVLEDVVVGPILRGPNEFCLTAPAPDPSKIPAAELLGVTVLLLVCEYQDQEFIRVGYYVNTDYDDEKLREGGGGGPFARLPSVTPSARLSTRLPSPEAAELLGVTVLLLICEYQDQEFIRVGYYVNTDYDDEKLREDPPERPQPERMVRNVLTERPRVTTHTIDWHRTVPFQSTPMVL